MVKILLKIVQVFHWPSLSIRHLAGLLMNFHHQRLSSLFEGKKSMELIIASIQPAA